MMNSASQNLYSDYEIMFEIDIKETSELKYHNDYQQNRTIDPYIWVEIKNKDYQLFKFKRIAHNSFKWHQKIQIPFNEQEVFIRVFDLKDDQLIGQISLVPKIQSTQKYRLSLDGHQIQSFIVLSMNIKKQECLPCANAQKLKTVNQKIIECMKQYIEKANYQGKTFDNLLVSIIQLYKNFSFQLQKISQQIETEISSQNYQQDELVELLQYVSSYLSNQVKSNNEFSQSFYSDVMEPYQQVFQNYVQNNQEIIENMVQDKKQLEFKINNILKEQDNFVSVNNSIEKNNQLIDSFSSFTLSSKQERLQKMINNQFFDKKKREQCQQDYNLSVDDYNQYLHIYLQKLKKYLQDFDINNDSRTQFCKFSLQKLIKQFQNMNGRKTENEDVLEKQQGSIGGFTVIKKLQQDLDHQLPMLNEIEKYKEKYKCWNNSNNQYNKYTQIIDQNSLKSLGNILVKDQREINEIIFEVFFEQPDQTKNSGQQLANLEIFNQKIHIEYLVNFIKYEFNDRKVIGLLELQFSKAKQLFKAILTYMDEDQQEIQIQVLLQCIKIVCRIYKKTTKKQSVYLANVLNNLAIWNNYQLWNKIYELILQDSNRMDKKMKLTKKRSIKNLISMIKGSNVQKKQDIQSSENVHQNILKEINYFMIQLQLNIELSSAIIVKLTQKYIPLDTKQQIENSILYSLLERQSNKRIGNLIQVKKKELKMDGECIFIQVLPYLDVIQDDVIQYSYLNRKINKKVYHQILNYADLKYLAQNRINIWVKLLKVSFRNNDYSQTDVTIPFEHDEIINLDLARTFRNLENEIDYNVLYRVLKTQALINRDIGYCQGMNYLVAFIHLQTRSEKLTYELFKNLIEKRFRKVFSSDLGNLNLLFYQFEKCLELFLPDISEHFKMERIECQHFLSPWLLTIFSPCLQYTRSSVLILQIWDIFILEGNKGLFKFGLYLFRSYQKEILNMVFEEVLVFLSDIHRTELFQYSQMNDQFQYYQKVQNIKRDIQQFSGISNQLLKDLEREYENSRNKVNQMIKRLRNIK